MRGWRVLLWTILAIGATLAGCYVLLHRLLPDDMCATEVFTRVKSPNGQLAAVVYQVDCGATTGFSRLVAVVPAADQGAELKSFFGISLGAQVDPALSMRDSLVRLEWRSNQSLVIAYPAGARIIRSAEHHNGVQVAYRTYVGASGAKTP